MALRRIFATLALVWMTLTLHAQYHFLKPELGVGVNQGVNLLPRVGFKPEVEQAFDVRYHGGITLRYVIQKHFGLQAEINYSQLGWKEKEDAGSFERRLDYIEIPFLSHLVFGGRVARAVIHLGPEIRFLVNDDASGTGNGDLQQTKAIDNRFDFGLTGGLGLELKSEKAGFFLLEARYNWGLTNIFDDDPGSDFSRSGNQAILVSFTYLYDVLKNK